MILSLVSFFRITICLGSLCLPLFATAQENWNVTLIPDSLLQGANEVIRHSEERFLVKNPGSAEYQIKRVVTILNDKASEANLVVHYDPFTKITNLKARLLDARGKAIKDFKKSDFSDLAAISDFSIYEDDRVKVLNLERGEFPYTLEYEYVLKYDGLRMYPPWVIQYPGTAVQQSSYFLSHPADMKVAHKLIGPEMRQGPEILQQEGGWLFGIKSLKALDSKADDTSYPMLCFSPDRFTISNMEGSCRTWQDFGLFYHKLNQGRDLLSAPMQQKVHTLTQNAATNSEKISILYRYLQENMRYVSVQLGIGGWQTFDARYVEENGYGDCKALTNFMMAMLKCVGIPAEPSLVYAGSGYREPTADFVYPRFNHVVLYVPEDSIWLECTSSNYPPNYMGSSLHGKTVLCTSPQGGRLQAIPLLSMEDNQIKVQHKVTLDATGKALSEVNIIYSGEPHEFWRYVLAEMKESYLRDYFLRNLNYSAPTVQSLSFDFDRVKPRFYLNGQLEFRRFASVGGKRLFVPLKELSTFEQIPNLQDIEKANTFKLEQGLQYSDINEIQFPASFEIESNPLINESLENTAGKVSINSNVQDNSLLVSKNMELFSGNFTGSQKEDLLALLQKWDQWSKAKLVLVNTAP